MAKKLTSDPVLMGVVQPVENLKRRFGEKNRYSAVKVEQADGEHEEWLLFTDKELERSKLNIGPVGDGLKPGRIYPHVVGTRRSWMVKLMYGKTPQLVLIGSSVIERARTRARKNPEDIPAQSWLADKLD